MGAWRVIAGVARAKSTEFSADLSDNELAQIKEQMFECLESRGGEVSARARAAILGRTYLSLNATGRQRFLSVLANEVTIDSAAVDSAVDALQSAEAGAARLRAERGLREALRSPRLRLYRQFTALPEGIKFIVDLRADLIRFKREAEELEIIEAELKSLLMGWFDVGLLDLVRIQWDSPASLLEKLIEYEAVHRIDDWSDLKNRLGPDRRCFAFFHRNMPNEPLIFVEVALVNGMSDNIQVLLDQSAPVLDAETTDTAIFYSISNAQAGLAGISFGDFLIKRVVELLTTEFPSLKTFATLSPIPGFRLWLNTQLSQDAPAVQVSASEKKRLQSAVPQASVNAAIKALLDEESWPDNSEYAETLQGPLTRLAAQYLTMEKCENGFARNRVAHFHLSNGARIERINWLADVSPNGLQQSAGMMVNYLYKLDEIEDNHENYRGEGKLPVSSSVKSTAKVKR